MGKRFLMRSVQSDALCSIVDMIQEIHAEEPRLAKLCEQCDAEWFLILPRLVWMCFLKAPISCSPLLASLLPHRFSRPSQHEALVPDAELQAFMANCKRVFGSSCDSTRWSGALQQLAGAAPGNSDSV